MRGGTKRADATLIVKAVPKHDVMTATRPRIPYIYEDYRTLPEDLSRRYELMAGDLYKVPAPTTA